MHLELLYLFCRLLEPKVMLRSSILTTEACHAFLESTVAEIETVSTEIFAQRWNYRFSMVASVPR